MNEQHTSKELFEAWLNSPASFPSDENPYTDWQTQHLYEAWCRAWNARAAHEPPAVPVAWMAADGRVITATAKEAGTRVQAAATASAEFTIPLYRGTQPPVPDDVRDAALWRALIGCARVRVLGSAGIYRSQANGYAHIGVEFWTRHEFASDPSAIEDLTNFATIARATATKESEHG